MANKPKPPLKRPGKSLLRELSTVVPAEKRTEALTNQSYISADSVADGDFELVHNDLDGRSDADCHPASAITNTAGGGIAATTVQAAIDELDDEKLAVDGSIAMTASLDFGQHEAVRMLLNKGTAFPTSPAPVEGQVFYRTDLDEVYIYDGAGWVTLNPGGASKWNETSGELVPITVGARTWVYDKSAWSGGRNAGYFKSQYNSGVMGYTETAVDRTNEKYCVRAANRTFVGVFCDYEQNASSPDDAPANRVRVFAKTDGKLYCVDPSGNEYDLTASGSGGIPSGCIIMWSGTIATIPAGYVLCDGNNSTPDLRNRFIVCADADDAGVAKTTIAGAASQYGGSVNYTPGGSNANENAHVHDIAHAHGNGQKAGSLGFVKDAPLGVGTNSGAGSSHSHNFTGATSIIIPPYYALAYIMKT